jgi:AcrR family transcriptional regulator
MTHSSANEPTKSYCRGEDAQSKRGEEILAVAVQVFAQNGYAQADVQEIADRVGIGKATIYRQFGNKECLFLAATQHARGRLTEAVDAAADAEATPLASLRSGMYAYIGFFDEHPEVVELLIQQRAHFRGRQTPTFFEQREDHKTKWQEVFRQLIRDGVIRELPVQQVEEAITKFLFGVMFVNYFAGREKPLAQQCDEIFDVLFHGLLAPGQTWR